MEQTLQIIRGAEVYTPEKKSKQDVLIGGGKILALRDNIEIRARGVSVEIHSGEDQILVPGLVDTHVHICGGGGEGGFSQRTPEIRLSSVLKGGVTSMVGVLGTDGTTRTMSNLLAKAGGLTEEGIDTWVLTGSYQVPVRTVTGSITDDIILIDKVIGTGEICLADHRSSHPTAGDLIKLISDSRLGGLLSGKAGIVNLHMGDSKKTISLLQDVLEQSDLPISQLQPTHMNRNPWLFEAALAYARRGGFLDFTTSTTARFIEEGEIPAAAALKEMLDKGVDVSQITFSSDAQGSLPLFDATGDLKGMTFGKPSTLLKAFQESVLTQGVPLEQAIRTVTANPAARYQLPGKGRIEPGYDADLLLLSKKDLSLVSLFSKGKKRVEQGKPLSLGMFEEEEAQ